MKETVDLRKQLEDVQMDLRNANHQMQRMRDECDRAVGAAARKVPSRVPSPKALMVVVLCCAGHRQSGAADPA